MTALGTASVIRGNSRHLASMNALAAALTERTDR